MLDLEFVHCVFNSNPLYRDLFLALISKLALLDLHSDPEGKRDRIVNCCNDCSRDSDKVLWNYHISIVLKI